MRKLLGRWHWLRGRSSRVPRCWSLPPPALLQASSEHPPPPGPSVFPSASPTSPAPAKAKGRVKGAKILHRNNLKGRWWMVL